ncbi:hypothetical protein [Weissella confusa]|uniref:hypothetical protein n=1 Tax=Weissella confusa TaxID=1583 RepID=UPI0035234A9B
MKGKNTRGIIIAGISGVVIATIITFLVLKLVYKNPEIYGNLADWFSAFGTIFAAATALCFGLRQVVRNYKIYLYQGEVNYQYTEKVKTTINFAIYNGGNKPFVLYTAYLEGDKNEKLELEFDNSNFSHYSRNMPYLLGDNEVDSFYLSGSDEKWWRDNHPKNPYLVLQEISGDKVKKRLKDFVIE